MDALFARYFDGDLNEREAREFLEAIAADPRLEKELREYERMLALGKSLPTPKAPAGFTERVMEQISLEEKRETAASHTRRAEAAVGVEGDERSVGGGPERRPFRLPLFGARWAGVAVAAAAIAIAYIGGVYTARSRTGAPTPVQDNAIRTGTATTAAGPGTVPSATMTDISPGFVNQAAAESGLRYVRLAYVPTDPSVEKVTVVGSFNNWDPDATPLRRQDGVWSTILVLAPGSYEYMFFENGARWVTDPLAVQTRDDGFGGANAVLDVGA
jgi:anti-sigma factor RsiW